jgi:ubiquinone/menaquinone biosynthesis C-methylase UbiE
MNQDEKQQVVDRYAARLKQHGADVRALGWRDAKQQALRFSVLAGGVAFRPGESVLDIGCGFGDLYHYLRSLGRDVRYTGCDISPDVLEVARRQVPEGHFDLRDALQQPYDSGEFDHVFISGIFNHVIADNVGFLQQTLAEAFRISRRGVYANMTTDQVDYRDAHLHYFNPESVLSYCRSLSRHVAVRHDYPLYEFSVFIYHQANDG